MLSIFPPNAHGLRHAAGSLASFTPLLAIVRDRFPPTRRLQERASLG